MKSLKEEIIDKLLDAKLMTAAGGIILSALLGWFYFKTTNNHIEHNQRAFEQFNSTVIEIQKEDNEKSERLKTAIESQTRVSENTNRLLEVLINKR